MNPMSNKKDTGDGGNEHRIFIKDARIGWRTILNDPMKQLENGITQYEYLESLGPRLGGQARRLLDNFIDKWDYRDEANPFYEEAVTRGASEIPSAMLDCGTYKLNDNRVNPEVI